MNVIIFRFAAIAVGCVVLPCLPASGDDAATVSFRSKIAPILLDSCLACHGPKKAEGGYRVDTYDELLKAGDSGELPIAASPEHVSELLRRVTSDDESERMPADSEPLAPEQIDSLKKWIAAGAKFDGENTAQSLAMVIPPIQYAAPPEVYQQAIPITATTFSPDGKLMVTSGYHELAIWNTEDAKLVRRITNLGQRVFALAFSPDGHTLAVGCGEPGRSGDVRLVDFNSGEIRGVVARTSDVVLDLAYRPGT
ncbi:MAG: c-type cytochrome domain-containing protein, partial [Planctomycetaceae bacterium]